MFSLFSLFSIKKDFKTNFCGLIGKDNNYDYSQYNTDNIKDNSSTEPALDIIGEILSKPKNNDDLEKIVSPRVKIQSRSRLPIYYTNNRSMMITESLQEVDYSNEYQQPWHSTKIEVDQTFGQSFQTSTRPSDLLKIAIKPQNSINSDDDTSKSSFDSTSTTSDNDEKLFKIDSETIYACCLDYNAQNPGDLTVRVSDRINILYDHGDDFILVKHLRSEACGYIPRKCILDVKKFIANLN